MGGRGRSGRPRVDGRGGRRCGDRRCRAAGRARWFVLRRARHRRLLVGARLVTVLAPPRVHPEGAAALWGHLAGLARPRWRRLLFGQPHLCFEYLITATGR